MNNLYLDKHKNLQYFVVTAFNNKYESISWAGIFK